MAFQMIIDDTNERINKIKRVCLTIAWEAGEYAALQGMARNDNPYSRGAMQEKWDDGFTSVHQNEIGMEYDATA